MRRESAPGARHHAVRNGRRERGRSAQLNLTYRASFCVCVCVCVCYLQPLLPPTLEFQVLSFPILSPSIYSRFEAPAPGGMRVIDQGS